MFDLLEDDSRFLELRPGAIAHRDVVGLPNGGHACTQEYEANGHRFIQTCRTTRFERPACVVEEVVSPSSRATVTSTFVSEADATRLTIHQEVHLPHRLAALRRRALRRNAETWLTAALERIKDVAEST